MTLILYMKNKKIKRYRKVKDFSICPNNPKFYMIHIAIVNGSKHKLVAIDDCERFEIGEENVTLKEE